MNEAIKFLQESTYYDATNATTTLDPYIDNVVLVEGLIDPYGDVVRAIVYLSPDGRHDFEVED